MVVEPSRNTVLNLNEPFSIISTSYESHMTLIKPYIIYDIYDELGLISSIIVSFLLISVSEIHNELKTFENQVQTQIPCSKLRQTTLA